MLLLSIIINLFICFFVFQLAIERKKDPWFWVILAMFIGVFALLLLYFLKPKVKKVVKPPKEEVSVNEKNFFSNPSYHNHLWWAVDTNGNILKEMSFQRLQGLLKEKKVNPSSLVWNETFSEWKTLSELIEKTTN